MKKLLAVAALAVAGLVTALMAGADDGKGNLQHEGNGPLTFAIYGDAPYGTTPTDTSEFQATPAFVDAINRDHNVRLVAHVGDIHSGKQFCTFAYDESVYDLWTQYSDPLVYTPGDNETTDCHKAAEGGNVKDASGNYADYANGDPVANLGLIRQIFFANPGQTLGAHPMKVVSQAQAYDPAHPDDAQFVENVMWEQARSLFVTVDLPGGSNDDADPWYGVTPLSGEQIQERTLRDGANLRWLDAAFAQARSDSVSSVVILLQADMWDTADAGSHQTNYEPYVADIARNTTAFGKPVLLFNGDSHIYRSDNPLTQSSTCYVEPSSGAAAVPCTNDAYGQHPGYDIPNFHRIVVHGSTFPLEYLRVSLDAAHPPAPSATSFGPFSWERVQP